MPELPEIETVRRITGPLITGRTITAVKVEKAKIIADMEVQEFINRVTNRKVIEVGRRAKILLVYLDDGSHMVIRFGMTGSLISTPSDIPVNKHARVYFDMDDSTRVEFRDMRMFGNIWLIPAGVEDIWSGIDEVGIEPDDPKLSGKFLKESLGNSTRAVKAALLDQGIVCGLGNIYADEVLWRSMVCPEKQCCKLRKKDWDAIAKYIPEVINEAIEGNFVSPEEFRESDGGRYRFHRHDAYGREGEPCNRCGEPMVRSVIGQRSSCWCPKCQKK